MSHHAATCFSGDGTCRVGRAIIDDEGAISSALDVGDDGRDHRCLIVGSDDNPYLRLLQRHRLSRNEEKKQKAGDPLGERTIATPHSAEFEQQLAAGRGRLHRP